MGKMGTGQVLFLLFVGMFIVRLVLGIFLNNSTAFFVAIFAGLVLGGVWMYRQVKEAEAADEQRRRNRR